jgi:hypothetical protein
MQQTQPALNLYVPPDWMLVGNVRVTDAILAVLGLILLALLTVIARYLATGGGD